MRSPDKQSILSRSGQAGRVPPRITRKLLLVQPALIWLGYQRRSAPLASGTYRREIHDGKPVLVKLATIEFVEDGPGPGKPGGINRFIGRRPIDRARAIRPGIQDFRAFSLPLSFQWVRVSVRYDRS